MLFLNQSCLKTPLKIFFRQYRPTTDPDGISQERQVANNGQHPLAGHRPRSSLLLDDLGPPTGWMAWENALAFLTGVVMLSE